MILYPDQISTLNSVYDKYRAGYNHVLLQAATGSGKSAMASSLIKRSMGNGNLIWFVVPRRELIKQMSETFNDFDISHGVIASDYDYDPMASVYIVSLGTITRRLDRITRWPSRVIYDEVHFGKDGLGNVIGATQVCGARTLGLSATPNRSDGSGLGKWFETMVCGPSIRWLIENRRLSRYRAFAPDHIDLSKIGKVAGDYNQGQLAQKMEQDRVLIGNSVKHYKKHAMGKLGITFAVGVKHSQLLAQAYRDAGIPAAHMDGDTPDDERKRIAIAFARREILQLCNSDLLTFGYDISSASGIKGVVIECMTDCKPTMSLPLQMQKWGRVLRYSDDPHLIFDHANNTDTHGLPDEDREWMLEDKPKAKRGSGERTIEVQSCPACYFVHKPALSCPSCGHVYEVKAREIEEVDGELQEVVWRERKKEKWKAKTLQDLIVYGKKMGYKPGWAYQYARAKGIK